MWFHAHPYPICILPHFVVHVLQSILCGCCNVYINHYKSPLEQGDMPIDRGARERQPWLRPGPKHSRYWPWTAEGTRGDANPPTHCSVASLAETKPRTGCGIIATPQGPPVLCTCCHDSVVCRPRPPLCRCKVALKRTTLCRESVAFCDRARAVCRALRPKNSKPRACGAWWS